MLAVASLDLFLFLPDAIKNGMLVRMAAPPPITKGMAASNVILPVEAIINAVDPTPKRMPATVFCLLLFFRYSSLLSRIDGSFFSWPKQQVMQVQQTRMSNSLFIRTSIDLYLNHFKNKGRNQGADHWTQYRNPAIRPVAVTFTRNG